MFVYRSFWKVLGGVFCLTDGGFGFKDQALIVKLAVSTVWGFGF